MQAVTAYICQSNQQASCEGIETGGFYQHGYLIIEIDWWLFHPDW